MIEESFFENENFSEEEKANTAFQIVTAMRDVLNVALKSKNVPTYEKSIAYIKDISPITYRAIIDHLPDKNESDLVKRFKELAESEVGFEDEVALNAKAVELILLDIDKCDSAIHKNPKNKTASRSYKRHLTAALKHFQTRILSEHQLLRHDFYTVTRKEFKLIDEEVDRKDYHLPDGNVLRMYLAHPDKIEHVLGVDVIYECYDMKYNLVRVAHLQYKTWKALNLSFDERESRQLERMKLHTCSSNHCVIPKAFASANPYRFPYCSAFLRPTNKMIPRGSKMKTMGDHIPLCKLNELLGEKASIPKSDIQKISLTQSSFEEAFNKYHAGSGWMPIGDLEKFYRKRKLLDLAGNVRLIAQEIEFDDDEVL